MSRTLFYNCRAYTLCADNSTVEAIVADGEIIAFAGLLADAYAFAGPDAERVDLDGRTVLPGFVDAHCHLAGFGGATHSCVDLKGSTSITDILTRLKAHARPEKWIVGSGFDQDCLLECRYPTRHDLDLVSDTQPVAVFRVCGHSCVLNTRALEIVGADPSLDGVEHGRLSEGDAACVWDHIPSPGIEEIASVVLANCSNAVANGVTSAHTITGGLNDLDALRVLHKSHLLPLRVNAILPFDCWPALASEGLRSGAGDSWLRIGALKLYADGSLGARTAALTSSYADEPNNSGRLLIDAQELSGGLVRAHRAGFQFAFHAIGDRAIEECVEAVRLVLEAHPSDICHRIEHASLLSPDLLRKMIDLHIIACVQPQFVVSDFWAIDRLGHDRIHWYHPFRTMIEAGLDVCTGSDFPVEPISPLQAIHRAVCREVHTLDERLTVDQAVRICCLGGARASGEEYRKGTIEAGKQADLVVLSDDVFCLNPEAIESVNVDLTIVGGQVLFRR